MVKALALFLPLLGAFVNAWLPEKHAALSRIVSYLLLAMGLSATITLSVQLGAWDLSDPANSVILITGVGEPPLSINLEITAGGTLAAIVMYAATMFSIHRFSSRSPKSQPLILALLTASLGLLYATDIFNSFVFLEIGSIVTIGLTAACRGSSRWEAAIKVALVSGLVAILYLLAVVVVYRTTGMLTLQALSAITGAPAILVTALLLTVIVTEIKAFPLAGWGLDFYQGASSTVAGLYSATWSLAVLLWAARVLPLLPLSDPRILAWIGAAGLVLSQLAGLRSSNSGRIMGYSTSAYASLLLVAAGTTSGAFYQTTVLVLMIFSSIAKFSLFMLGNPEVKDRWSGYGTLLFLIPVLLLAGIPPFPVFFAKFAFLAHLAFSFPTVFYVVVAGLFLEAVYLFRFWSICSGEKAEKGFSKPESILAVLVILAGAVWISRMWWGSFSFSGSIIGSSDLRNIFHAVFAVGTLLCLPGVFNRIGTERNYWFWLLISGAALTILPAAGNSITFFLLWEISAFAAVIGVSKGTNASSGAFWYAVFASLSGYLLLAGLLLSRGSFITPGLPAVLATVAAMIKMGQFGMHLWSVRAYPSAPGTMPAFLSGTASKAAVLLLAAVAVNTTGAALPWGSVLAWLGALTALAAAVMAALAPDYRKMLAYASVSQLGYVIMGLALGSVLGWTAAFYHTVHHLIFKMALFLGAAGVVYRTGTSEFNDLGGLVKKMPWTFAFTLISVISFAGIPPLAGFGGKWLLYNGLIEAGWLPVTVVAMFASVVAFLYCFRLLHGLFLGQLSPRNAHVKEAPLPLLIPQGILALAIMVLGFKPTIFLNYLVPVIEAIPGLSGLAPVIQGDMVLTAMGTWNAWMAGLMVIGIFGFVFVFYWVSGHKPRYVGQLDIGFAGEIPPPPDEIHYSNNFFRPYARALAFLPRIHAEKIFSGAVKTIYMLGDGVRALFTGDGRTYLAHSLLFLIVIFIFLNGGM
jgi:formate hydrogenlyase subunit 3/multisubunit Na+/H+ antiporter MnhD subunit